MKRMSPEATAHIYLCMMRRGPAIQAVEKLVKFYNESHSSGTVSYWNAVLRVLTTG